MEDCQIDSSEIGQTKVTLPAMLRHVGKGNISSFEYSGLWAPKTLSKQVVPRRGRALHLQSGYGLSLSQPTRSFDRVTCNVNARGIFNGFDAPPL